MHVDSCWNLNIWSCSDSDWSHWHRHAGLWQWVSDEHAFLLYVYQFQQMSTHFQHRCWFLLKFQNIILHGLWLVALAQTRGTLTVCVRWARIYVFFQFSKLNCYRDNLSTSFDINVYFKLSPILLGGKAKGLKRKRYLSSPRPHLRTYLGTGHLLEFPRQFQPLLTNVF